MSLSESVFVGVGAVGFLLLLLSFVIGGVEHEVEISHEVEVNHEVDHGDTSNPSWLSMKVGTAAMVGFGAAGYLASFYGLPAILSWPIAVVGFLAMGSATYWWVIVPLSRQQSNSLVRRNDYIRCTGTLSLPITEEFPGQVVFQDPTGNRVTLRATSLYKAPLEKGAPVLIVDMNDAGAVVTPFPSQELEIR